MIRQNAAFKAIRWVLLFVLPLALSAHPINLSQASPLELIFDPIWSEDCAEPGRTEVDNWIVVSANEWCEEFVGDFARVQSVCYRVSWQPFGVNRWQLAFDGNDERQTVEWTAPNRLSVFSGEAPNYVQEKILGRARKHDAIASHYALCE